MGCPASSCIIPGLVRAPRCRHQQGLQARHPSKDPERICGTAHQYAVPQVYASSSAWSAHPDGLLSEGSWRDTHQRIHSAFAGLHTRCRHQGTSNNHPALSRPTVSSFAATDRTGQPQHDRIDFLRCPSARTAGQTPIKGSTVHLQDNTLGSRHCHRCR